MFEQTLTTRIHRVQPREAVFASISVFFHAAGIALLLTASWLTLSPVPLPKLHTDLVQPVFFGAGGPTAPKLGGGAAAVAKPAAREDARAAAPKPEELAQPQPAVPSEAEAPASDATARPETDSSSAPAGPGVPDGSIDGALDGKRGGVCVGDDCNPEGVIGEGPGNKDALPGATELYNPWTAQLTEPVLIQSSRVLPVYPEIARHAGVKGSVILQAVIGPEGKVGSIVVLRESPERVGFGEAAIRAVSQWRYRPGLLAGNPVSVQMTITVEFTLSR